MDLNRNCCCNCHEKKNEELIFEIKKLYEELEKTKLVNYVLKEKIKSAQDKLDLSILNDLEKSKFSDELTKSTNMIILKPLNINGNNESDHAESNNSAPKRLSTIVEEEESFKTSPNNSSKKPKVENSNYQKELFDSLKLMEISKDISIDSNNSINGSKEAVVRLTKLRSSRKSNPNNKSISNQLDFSNSLNGSKKAFVRLSPLKDSKLLNTNKNRSKESNDSKSFNTSKSLNKSKEKSIIKSAEKKTNSPCSPKTVRFLSSTPNSAEKKFRFNLSLVEESPVCLVTTRRRKIELNRPSRKAKPMCLMEPNLKRKLRKNE